MVKYTYGGHIIQYVIVFFVRFYLFIHETHTHTHTEAETQFHLAQHLQLPG